MYEIQTDQTSPINFLEGDFPVAKGVGAVASDATVRKYAPIISTDGGITEATADELTDLIGIAASEPTDGGVVYYMTGEFCAGALVLPDGVTLDALTPIAQKLNIYLK
jgi:hypothetical protein